MTRKYNLQRMLTEIREDEQLNRKKHEQLTQAEIRRLFAELRKPAGPSAEGRSASGGPEAGGKEGPEGD